MATAEALDRAFEDIGRLANNGMIVQMLQTAVSNGRSDAAVIPGLFLQLARVDGWTEYIHPDKPDDRGRVKPADFRAFVEKPRPEGLQSTRDLLLSLLKPQRDPTTER